MDIFGYGKALADFWTLGSKALMTGQENAMRAFSDNLAKMASNPLGAFPGLPDLKPDVSEVAEAGQKVAELWSSALNLSTSLLGQVSQEKDADQIAGNTIRNMMDPRAWLSSAGDVENVLQRITEGPRFADAWNIERKYLQLFQAWTGVQRRAIEHAAIVLEAWLKTARAFSEQLARATAEGRRPKTSKELLALWTETANGILLETQHSDVYLSSQAALVRAATQLRASQSELAEYYGQMLGLPTRAELDDLYRTVTDLRREMRELRRQARDAAPSAGPVRLPRRQKQGAE